MTPSDLGEYVCVFIYVYTCTSSLRYHTSSYLSMYICKYTYVYTYTGWMPYVLSWAKRDLPEVCPQWARDRVVELFEVRRGVYVFVYVSILSIGICIHVHVDVSIQSPRIPASPRQGAGRDSGHAAHHFTLQTLPVTLHFGQWSEVRFSQRYVEVSDGKTLFLFVCVDGWWCVYRHILDAV